MVRLRLFYYLFCVILLSSFSCNRNSGQEDFFSPPNKNSIVTFNKHKNDYIKLIIIIDGETHIKLKRANNIYELKLQPLGSCLVDKFGHEEIIIKHLTTGNEINKKWIDDKNKDPVYLNEYKIKNVVEKVISSVKRQSYEADSISYHPEDFSIELFNKMEPVANININELVFLEEEAFKRTVNGGQIIINDILYDSEKSLLEEIVSSMN